MILEIVNKLYLRPDETLCLPNTWFDSITPFVCQVYVLHLLGYDDSLFMSLFSCSPAMDRAQSLPAYKT